MYKKFIAAFPRGAFKHVALETFALAVTSIATNGVVEIDANDSDRHIYLPIMLSLANGACNSNTVLYTRDDGSIQLVAERAFAKGEEITVSSAHHMSMDTTGSSEIRFKIAEFFNEGKRIPCDEASAVLEVVKQRVFQ
jgi:hypothetical protein